MTPPKLEVDCPKHGRQKALPSINHVLPGPENWPDDVEDASKYPRHCIRCVAEAMVNPIRRAA